MPLHTYKNAQEKREALDESNEFFASKTQEAKDEAMGGLSKREREAFDEIEKHYDKEAPGITSNIDNTREAESTWKNNYTPKGKDWEKVTLKSLKGKGPIAAISALITLVGALLGIAGTSLGPVVIPNTAINDLNDSNASQQRHAVGFWGGKAGGNVQKKLSYCSGAISIRCKFNTLPNTVADDIESRENTATGKREETGFKLVDKQTANNRTGFSGIQFPDGEIVRDAAQLNAKLKNDVQAASDWKKVSDKNHFFNRGNFFPSLLAEWKLNKGKKIEGDNAEEAKKSYEEAVKGEKGSLSTNPIHGPQGEGENDPGRKNNENSDDASRFMNDRIASGEKLIGDIDSKLSSGPAGIAAGACLAYNASNTIAAGAKTIKLLRYARFALVFLTLAGAIYAGAATPAEVGQGMNILVPPSYPSQVEDPDSGEMIANPYAGLTAFDAEAFRAIAYGDEVDLVGIASRLFVAGGALGVIQTVVDWVNTYIGKEKVKTICSALNSTAATVISFLAAPAFAFLFTAIVSVLPVDEMVKAVVNQAIELVAGADLTTSIQGVEAGNVLIIGTGAIMGLAAARYGLKPGKFPEIKRNMAANYEFLERDTAIAKYDALKTPLDVKNQYSFLGSLAYQIASTTSSLRGSFTQKTTRLLSLLPSSLGAITKNANAAYSMPVANYTEKRFSQCKDEAYAEAGITPDLFCMVRYVPFDYVDPYTTLDYMEANKQIDLITGDALPGTHLEKFTRFCTKREDPVGSSSVPLEEEEDGISSDWYTGKECTRDTEENKMASNYIGYHVTQQIVDLEGPPSGGPTPSVSGDAKGMAMAVANNPNIRFTNPQATKTQLEKFSRGEPVFNECGAQMTISKYLLGALLTNSSKYSILINNIGFREDRNTKGPDWDCNYQTRQHTISTAVDLNEIQIIGGAGTGILSDQNPISRSAAVANQYATDFLFALPRNRGGVGQSQAGINPTFPQGSVALNGSHLFNDEPDHLHIDARNRQDLTNDE